MTEKVCTKCGHLKSLDEYSYNPLGKGKRKSWCKLCSASHNKIFHRCKDGTRKKKKTVVVPPDTVCEICGRKPGEIKMCRDHNHRTGNRRGWLCNFCNMAIGLLQEDIPRFTKAITYLEKYNV